ncbi:MAG: hypothetical protein JNM42_08900 [Propionivibrio sp.]|uniref:hypothetical protein n=1 Tax=Propionivibrio sp. TaxID=2212460 RepID=UPI001A3BA864|nr:hypothetical protein [Propionivibrio sp.]MBL8414540.1 hypothetical protein [Propionivibrio sp.]
MPVKIPTEVLLPYLSESDNKTLSEDKGAQPVDSSAKLRATLSNSLSKQRHALEETLKRVEQGKNGQENHTRSGAQKAGAERRQEQRRKEKLPVLLDTRLSRSRRKSARDPAIDCKI